MASWLRPTPMMGACGRRETFARRAWTRGTGARARAGVRGASDAMVWCGAFARARAAREGDGGVEGGGGWWGIFEKGPLGSVGRLKLRTRPRARDARGAVWGGNR